MLNDINFWSDPVQVDLAVEDSKQIFGENVPYIVEERLGTKVVIFNDHFITTAREAMTTTCMAKMNASETLLFNKFVDYQNGASYRDITTNDDNILKALDAWFMDDLNCVEHPVVNQCYDSPTHTWDTCAVWPD